MGILRFRMKAAIIPCYYREEKKAKKKKKKKERRWESGPIISRQVATATEPIPFSYPSIKDVPRGGSNATSQPVYIVLILS